LKLPDRRTGRGTAQIADHNSRAILELLRRSGPLTRNELAGSLGLTIPGITNITRRLLGEGLVTETRRKTPSAAVPTAHYAIDPDGAFAIGARQRGSKAEGILVDLIGNIRDRREATDIGRVISALEKASGPSANIVGIGIASEHAEVDGTLVESPVIAATLAEWSASPGNAANGLAMVLIEDRIRAGLFFHGRPFAGVHGRAGRIGEMRTGPDRRPLDEIASAASYRAVAKRDAARDDWIHDAAQHLLDAVFALTGFLGLGRVVIGGDLPPAIVESLIAEMARVSAARVHEATALDLPEILPAAAGADAVLMGAALLPFFAKLLPGSHG